MSNDAFLLPRSGRAAWVNGDAVNRWIMLYTLDEALNLQSVVLSLP